MDTTIIIGVIIGSVVILVLVFGKTVLRVAWTENGTRELEMTQTRNRNAAVQEHLHYANNRRREVFLKQNENSQKSVQVQVDSDTQIKSKSKSQTPVQFKRSSNLNELINKRVKTSDLIHIGNVIAIDNQSMTVLHYTKQEYVIPTYYIREYDEENVWIDTSIRYLYHYQTKGKPHPWFLICQSCLWCASCMTNIVETNSFPTSCPVCVGGNIESMSVARNEGQLLELAIE
ncbi:MAG: hypothetical protein WBP64_21415 [Nitrososphaeraceae archaeon]